MFILYHLKLLSLKVMAITKATVGKSKYSVSENSKTKTNNNSKSKTKNFDLGDSKINLSSSITGWVGILIGIITFVFGIGWFVASQWIFDVRSESLKSEIKNNFYTKEEANSLINGLDINKPLNEFKNCILQNQGYWPCLK